MAAIYSTFLQRGFDQVVHDCAIQKLHVVFVLDRGGIVGADGPTHHGSLDLSYLRCIPGMVVMSPKDEQELRDMLFTAIEHKEGPIALRYPRGNALGVPLRPDFQKLEIGRGETLRKGNDISILAIGNMVPMALGAADILKESGIEAEIVNMRFVKPIDDNLVRSAAEHTGAILTVEDNAVNGGFGSAVLESLARQGLNRVSVKLHGLPDEFVEHGTPNELHRLLQLDAQGIADVAKQLLRSSQDAQATQLITG